MAKNEPLALFVSKKHLTRYSVFAHTGFMFAFCSGIKKEKIRQITNFAGCREDLSGQLYNNRTRIPTDNLRLLVRTASASRKPGELQKCKRKFNKDTRTGLRIVNIMEKRHKWPLTKMRDIAPREDLRENSSWEGSGYVTVTSYIKMLEASNRWMRSPHMISLYALLFRLPVKSPTKFGNIKSYKALKAACDSCKRSTTGDPVHVNRTFKFWDPIMANFDNMFKGLPFKKAYNKRGYGQYTYDEGIYKLCTFRSSNAEIADSFAKVMKAAGIK